MEEIVERSEGVRLRAGRTRAYAPAHEVSVLHSVDDVERLVPEWTELFYKSETANPFAHPAWLVTWARHFTRAGQLRVLAVRRDGELIGIAPFYLARYGSVPGLRVTILRLLGAGRHAGLTELPPILTLPDQSRRALRLAVAKLIELESEWDWVELSLSPEQGWFEPEWLLANGSAGRRSVLHKGTVACVVLPLPEPEHDVLGGLKRNLKESIRRARNRLKRDGHDWDMTVIRDDPGALSRALDHLIPLHRARATMPGKMHHPDYLSDPAELAFTVDALHRMLDAGQLRMCLMNVGGEPVAGQVMLIANRSSYFSFSGLEPSWWRYNVNTLLMFEYLRRAVQLGDKSANLSTSPTVAKLRWSEQLELHNQFIVVGGRRRSRLGFSLYQHLRAGVLVQRISPHALHD